MTPAIYYLSGLQITSTVLLYAYSLRRVVPTYTGPLIRVRNGSSGSSPQFDVGFDANGNLDTVALLSGMSSANIGFVMRWYDQSGNGKDATGGVLSTGNPDREPVIVNIGKVLFTKPGPNGTVLPATSWGRNFSGMSILSAPIDVNNSSIFIVCSNNVSVASQRGINFGANYISSQTIFPRVASGVSDRLMYNNVDRITLGTTSTANKIYSMLASPVGVRAWKNNEENPIGLVPATNTTVITPQNINIGTNFNTGSELFDGSIQEMLFYKGNLAPSGITSRSSITAEAMTYYGIYRLSSVTTDNVNYTDPTGTATGGGDVFGEFGFSVTAKGVCWGTSQNPTINLATRTIDGQGAGSFTSNLNFLQAYTTYYARAYATNSAGTAYGDEKQFITDATPTGNFILDLYPSAYHAYSLRRLRTYYTGFCLRIRRTTTAPEVTTTTADLTFDSNNTISLNSGISYVSGEPTFASTLGQFCAAPGYINTDGYNPCEIFVVTWYDQSGNNKNPTQAVPSQQPRLVRLDTGIPTLETSQGKAAVRFISTSPNILITNDTSIAFNNVSSYVVGNSITTTSNIFFSINNTADTRFYLPNGNNISYVTSGTFTGYINTAGINRLYELICGPSTTSAYSNQLQLSPSSVSSEAVSNAFIAIGRTGVSSFSAYANGYISEIISFVGTSNRLDIETNMMDYYSVQKIPLVTTADISYIDPTGTAIGGGVLIDDFGVTTMRGIVWSTSPNPTLGFGAATNEGQGGIGAFTSNLTFLASNTTYYVKAYAINAAGVGYGDEKQFITSNAPMNLILDLYPSAYHAYSLRKLRTAYAGVSLRVRRTTTTPSATTTTVDLYFDAFGTISLNSAITYVAGPITFASSLGEFCAAPGFINVDGYDACEILVSTWFDQSGNNKNVTNTTLSAQPRLVRLDTGVATLELSGGKVAVRFTNANGQRLQLADASVPLNNVSSYALGNSLATTNNAILSMGDTINTNLFWLPQGTNIAYRSTSTWGNGNIPTNPRLYELICGTSVVNAYANGGLRTPTSPPTPMTGNNNIIRLGQYSTNIFMNGYVTEVISFVGTSNRTQIESNINTYYNVWT
jgi:hypothetical protein